MLGLSGRPPLALFLLMAHLERNKSWISQSSLQRPTTKNLQNPKTPNPKTLRLRLRAPLAKVKSRACPPRAPAKRPNLLALLMLPIYLRASMDLSTTLDHKYLILSTLLELRSLQTNKSIHLTLRALFFRYDFLLYSLSSSGE